ncbi:MAG: acyl-CoA dehydrogenase family protein [Burkholderiales bacterium]
MIHLHDTLELPVAGLSGFDPPASEEELAIQQSAHRFAKDVLRPIGRALDRMSAEEAIAPGSPYWTVFAEAQKLGLDPSLFAQFEPAAAARLESMIGEELGWGDSGLATSLAAAQLPLLMAASAGRPDLAELCMGKIGCWLITQPDRGSDVGVMYADDWPAGVAGNKGNVTAKVSGDEIVLNGQCSAWVSNGAVAQVALCYIAADYGDGFTDANGIVNGLVCIAPLDVKGVSRGKPLEKIGQRSLPQGEIYFDNVRLPRRFAIAEKDRYYGNLSATWSYAGTHMCQTFTGVARAAFEHALAYAHERKQGGAPLARHQLVRWRLGDMGRRVELARAVARRAVEYARLTPRGHAFVTAQAKVTVTEEAMKVVHEALQMFGGNGTTLEYPVEKLFRDTRSALIEDGENYVLAMRFGGLLSRLYENGWANG